ncbi:MAG: hypothetical protein AVDCRST_MAG73-938, partial [uncultured Thermomicrobiales bacterium]
WSPPSWSQSKTWRGYRTTTTGTRWCKGCCIGCRRRCRNTARPSPMSCWRSGAPCGKEGWDGSTRRAGMPSRGTPTRSSDPTSRSCGPTDCRRKTRSGIPTWRRIWLSRSDPRRSGGRRWPKRSRPISMPGRGWSG